MSTFYAAFKVSSGAQQMVDLLIEGGVLVDDISVITALSASEGRADGRQGVEPQPVDGSISRAPSDVTYGGGISTTRPDDDISTVEESDESQELAEDLTYESRTQGQIEAISLEDEITSGFPTEDSISLNQGTRAGDADNELESIVLPGFAIIQGGGELATIALQPASGARSLAAIRSHLTEQGVDGDTVQHLVSSVQDGGSLLSVELSAGSLQAIRLEELAKSCGSSVLGTFGTPRYFALDGTPNPTS